MAWFDEHIARYAGVQGGAAVVAGTRTPVRTIVAKYRTYKSDLKEVMRGFPHLSETQVCAALAYYEQYRAEVDDDTERHRRAFEALAVHAAS